ncbi:MAG: hypothetical protein WCT04_26675 [Planctomycetota bacterium]
MDWQRWATVGIAIAAGLWAAWTVLRPIVSAFRKTKEPASPCGGCGTHSGCKK